MLGPKGFGNLALVKALLVMALAAAGFAGYLIWTHQEAAEYVRAQAGMDEAGRATE